ncbi:MAG TPA: CNNM domain-containing protein [Phycisphaerae bacterium]|nr:CNNM domain-containing protein [Phycisphaerae bacterium]
MKMELLRIAAQATAATAASEPAAAHAPWVLWCWWALAVVALGATAVMSGSEIGLYSLSRVRLRLRTAKQDARALQLNEWLQRPTYALEGLLIWQNICSFAFTAAVGGILSWYGFGEVGQGVISVVVVTPLILIFAEILPKDLFHSYADRWVYRLVPVFKWIFRAITVVPLLPIVNMLSSASTWLVGVGKAPPGPVGPRAEIAALFQESAATGVLTGTQQDLVQRALRLARISVREVMIPWPRVVGVPATIGYEGFRALVRRYNVSRLPVLGKTTTEVLGVVEVLDALSAPPGGFRIRDYLRPMMTLIGEQNVRSAITLMQRARQTVALVVDRQGRAVGLVTMKDLIEELVGDLENW